MDPVGASQSQHARKLSTPTKEGNQLRNEKDEEKTGRKKLRHMLGRE